MAEWAQQLFQVSDEDVKLVRAYYNKTQEDIDKDCEIIKTWMNQQSHFPDDYDQDRIERFHLMNKFRIERTKEKLENYYTVRGENPEYFRNIDPENEAIQTALTVMMFVPLPKLNVNSERVYLFRFIGNDHLFSLEQTMILAFAMVELEMKHDYFIGLRLIIDLSYLSMTHYTKMDFNILAKTLGLFKECLSGRLLGFEYINPPLSDFVLRLFKLVFSPELYKKIRIHENLESLKTIVGEECLPRDYGGKMKSSEELHEDVKTTLLKNRDFIIKRGNMVSHENKRVGKVEKSEQFGADGTFRKINID